MNQKTKLKDTVVKPIPFVIPSGILYLDHNGKIIYANSIAADIFGRSTGKLHDQNISEINWEMIQENGLEFPEGKNPLEISLHTGEIITDAIMRVKYPQEVQYRWLMVTAMPVKDATGSFISQVVVHLRDISKGYHKTQKIEEKMDLFDLFKLVLESFIRNSDSSEDIYKKVISNFPLILACPEITSTRIVLGDQVFTSENFHESEIKKSIEFELPNSKIGKVEFHYAVNETSDLVLGLLSDDISLEVISEWVPILSQIAENIKVMKNLEEEALSAYDRMIRAWSAAMETREQKTDGHINRVTELTLDLAREMGFEEEELPNIRRGALLHDIGKLGIPDNIILKPGKLTEDEFNVVKKYPQYAEKWLSKIEVLQPAMAIPYYHNERWDGEGYPNGLKGEEIPLPARLFAVVNVWNALISDRPYRKALSQEEALDLIVSESGTHFDPDVVESFLRVLSRGDYFDTAYEIKIQAFGQERVWVKNRLVMNKDWQVSAAKDLFFLLLAHPEGLTKEQVGLYMWPDVSTEDLNVRFKNTLYRLRKAVGNQAVILGNHGYRFNSILEYYYDVEIFTANIERVEETSDVLEKVSHLNRAINEYHGNFLESFDGLWVMAEREGYRQMYLKALIRLAKYHYDEQELQQALKNCQRALDEDPMFEEAHRLAMRIHAMSGNRAEVIRQYQLCKKILIENYDIQPSRQTHDLYKSLINTSKFY